MLILRDNKLIHIDTSEDRNTIITAIKTVQQLNSKYAVKDEIYKLTGIEDYGKGEYVFRVIHSQYSDDSSIGQGYGVFKTKGHAIYKMLEDGFTVYSNNIQINK